MTHPGFEPIPVPRERAYPLPEDQLRFEQDFTTRYREQFPDSVPLLEGAMATLHRATGFPDQGPSITEAVDADRQPLETTRDERQAVADLINQPLSSTRASALELTMPPAPNTRPSTPYEQYRAGIEQSFYVLESDMPPETRALLDGLYQLVGTQLLRDDHGSGEPAGNVLLRGTYLGETVYLVEQFQRVSPSRHKGVEAQEAFKVWVVGEAEALGILHR